MSIKLSAFEAWAVFAVFYQCRFEISLRGASLQLRRVKSNHAKSALRARSSFHRVGVAHNIEKRTLKMSIEIQQSYDRLEGEALTVLNLSTESESDGGYGTPAEQFADDEIDRPYTPPSVPTTTTQGQSTADGIVVVDPELRERLVQQVEWYFSDENLRKDSFLMKHINRNKQGFVSLKLVSSFRKVKSLTKDWTVVLTSLRHSTFLALNEDETKVRRVSPAPQIDYSHIGRTVLVTNYPDSEPNVKSIEEQFGKYGEVVFVRILHPGKAVPLEVKPCRSKHPNLGKELCILVEYESEGGARVACERFIKQQSWRDDMKVQLLDSESKDQSHTAQEEEKTSKTDNRKNRKNINERKEQGNRRQVKENSPSRCSSPSPRHSREGSPAKQSQRRRPEKKHISYSPELQRRFLHPETGKDYASDSGCSAHSPSQSPKSSPEPPKKFFSPNSWRTNEKHIRDNCVIRQPIGPNGTRGFRMPRRPVRISVESC